MHFVGQYQRHFIVRGKDVNDHARNYLSGLLSTSNRKNIECIGADIPKSNYQGMQQMISDSPWSHTQLMDQVTKDAQQLLGGHRDSALYVDESSFAKKGDHSVGVQRQYCGRLGKVENCQMGVFACLGRGDRSTVVDFRLFLPEDWAKDDERCEKAKIPQEQRQHRTRTELALEMVKTARLGGSDHQWVGADCAYGNNQEFCAQLEDLGEKFMMDVMGTTKVWDADPCPEAPERGSEKSGRPRSACKAGNAKARQRSIEALVVEHFGKECRRVVIRRTSQGRLRAQVWAREVWVWDPGQERARRRMLVVRREEDGKMKYSWSNVAATTSWERLAFMQAQRYWIERAFEDGKSELGMAQYEVRGWGGWHHHMALVALAMLFVVKERISFKDEAPLLSARDVVELLDYYLPRRGTTEKEVLDDLVSRHKRRIQASQSHAKRNSQRAPSS